VAAESNEAVNNLFQKICEAGVDQKSVLRLGNTDKMPVEVQQWSFEEHYQKEADVKQRKHFDSKLAQEILGTYRVRNSVICLYTDITKSGSVLHVKNIPRQIV